MVRMVMCVAARCQPPRSAAARGSMLFSLRAAVGGAGHLHLAGITMSHSTTSTTQFRF